MKSSRSVRSSIGSSGSSSSSLSNNVFEGGSSEGKEEKTRAQEDDPYYDEDYGEEDEVDPNDPYHINRIDRIPHDSLKEMYTQVVDELLDIQLEFEEKLADQEEQSHVDLDNQKAELTAAHQKVVDELNTDLDKHKAAIAKLSDKLTKTMSQLNTARATSGQAPGKGASTAELQKLQEKFDQL